MPRKKGSALIANIESYADIDYEEIEEPKKIPTQIQIARPIAQDKKLDRCMDAAAWFRDISERGSMTADEKRYIDLIVIELSKFYFANLKELKFSDKCKEAIQTIGNNIKESGI